MRLELANSITDEVNNNLVFRIMVIRLNQTSANAMTQQIAL